MAKLTEKQLVDCIEEFYRDHYARGGKAPTELEVDGKINSYIDSKFIQDENDRLVLKNALMMQHNACTYASMRYASSHVGSSYYRSGSSIDIILFPTWPYGGYGYGYGCWGHHSHCGSGSSADGEAALIIFAIMAAASALAAAYGMAKDMVEMSTELYNNQRVAANLATLALAGAAVAGIAIASAALLASNPIGWGIVAVSALVIGVALLVKGVRALTTSIDAALDSKSGLASDSRFQLTASEEANLKSQMGASEQDIEKIKGIIRGLAVQAKSTPQTGFFGSKDRYLEIIKVLTDVKKGEISPEMKKQYGLEHLSSGRPEGEMQQAAI